MKQHKSAVCAVWEQLIRRYPAACHRVHVYGELCGGVYDHPAVLKAEGAKPVLTRVQYRCAMQART